LKKYDEAVTLYDKIVMDYPEEIRADNALFALAALHENQLEDLDRAKTLYEKLFLEYSNSTFAIDARKRYRRLRGDDIN
jgi:TolA-binding protein